MFLRVSIPLADQKLKAKKAIQHVIPSQNSVECILGLTWKTVSCVTGNLSSWEEKIIEIKQFHQASSMLLRRLNQDSCTTTTPYSILVFWVASPHQERMREKKMQFSEMLIWVGDCNMNRTLCNAESVFFLFLREKLSLFIWCNFFCI